MILKITPNVDTQGTSLQVGAAMITSSLIRIKNGYIEKTGGCTALTSHQFNGVCSGILGWQDLASNIYIGVGTTIRLGLYVPADGTFTDITPSPGVGGLGNQWFLAAFGQNLVASTLYYGPIYQWVPPISGGNIAVALPNSPTALTGIIVASSQQQIICWGAYSSAEGAGDPLLVSWCDVGNNTVWTAATSNQAGTFRIPTGTLIWQIVWFGLTGLLWTDLGLWSISYIGYPLVFGFNNVASNCGSISFRAAGVMGGVVAWMSENDFFQFSGGQVSPIPCSVHDFVFNNLDRSKASLVHCDTNTTNGEFIWRFPTAGSNGECTAYVKWTPAENGAWDCSTNGGALSAWSDQSIAGPPLGTDYNGNLLQFETADDYNGAVSASGFSTGWLSLSNTREFIFVERILPDMVLTTDSTTPGYVPSVTITLNFADEIPSNSADYPIRSYGPYTITPSTPYIPIGGRGRVVQIVLNCAVSNTFWRFGSPPAVICPDGHM